MVIARDYDLHCTPRQLRARSGQARRHHCRGEDGDGQVQKRALQDGRDGILVQLPLPMHISEDKVILSIDPKKDVDGFHPINLGNLFLGNNNGMIPCTPLGCIYMLKKELGSLNGLNATIVGRSNIVGKPMQSLLLKENCTTTITHSKTRNLSELTLKADILIAAIGMTEFIDNNYVKDKATVIDVGINRKKINDKFSDEDFIVNTKDGYSL